MLRFMTSSLMLRPMSWAFGAAGRFRSQQQQQLPALCATNTLIFWRAKSCLKTNKSAAKRFRVRGNGSLKRNHAGASHNTGHKTRSRCNRLRQSGPITEPKIEKRMKILMGV